MFTRLIFLFDALLMDWLAIPETSQPFMAPSVEKLDRRKNPNMYVILAEKTRRGISAILN